MTNFSILLLLLCKMDQSFRAGGYSESTTAASGQERQFVGLTDS